MSYLDLRYEQVSFKASHNSYAGTGKLEQHLEWDAIHPSNWGCRGIELDIAQKAPGWAWSVQHEPEFTTANPAFSVYLGYLKAWHDARPDHDPIFVTVDVKSWSGPHDGIAWSLDGYIDKHLGASNLLTPGEVIGPAEDLVQAVTTTGWPTVRELLGTFIFCLSGIESPRKESYAGYRAKERLCFVDRPVPAGSSTGTPSRRHGSIAIFNGQLTKAGTWPTMVELLTEKPGFLVRGYGANGEDRWQRALRARVNVLATDCVIGFPWAKVGTEPFLKTR
jgi:Phosphoinositide phospholipase C, Ca2+-dependent